MAKKSCCMPFQCFSSPDKDVSESPKTFCCMPSQGFSSPANDVSTSAKKFCCMRFKCFCLPAKDESKPADDFENMFEKVEENDVVGLMNYISQLLERIRIGKREAPVKNWSWPSNSSDLFNFLSEKKGVSTLKNITEAMTVVRGLLEKIGQASLVTAGLLVVAYGLERFEAVSANKDNCLHILEEMSHLAKIVHEYKERAKLEVGLQDEIKAATELIVKGAITCCTQIKSSGFSKFCSTAGNKEDLDQIKQDLLDMHRNMKAQMDICIYDAIENKDKHSLYRESPENAVGIDEKIREVMDLLELESTENAVAVIVYGIGGMGKSTLADAVFSRVNSEGCRCSMVEMFENIDSTPNIVELQKEILKDLMGKKDIPEIRKHADGQRKLHGMLQKVEAFICIDNVLDEEKLSELLPLPEDMIKAKKVRLLITARDINVGNAQSLCRIKRKKYFMGVISRPAAITLLKQKMSDDMVRKLNLHQFNQIIHICSGIPLMLILAAKALCSKEDRQNVYVQVMEELEKLRGFENKLYKFLAYDSLPEECKDPFMDICSYLNGWDWDKVADIVGEEELKKLESRALVSKDTNEKATVHDVILRISGLINKRDTGGIRLKFTTARELIDFLNDEDEKDIQRIKGIWMMRNSDSLDIPAQKLDLLHSSLRILALGKIRVMGECNEAFKKLIFLQADNVPNILWKKSKQLRYLSYKPAQDLNQQTKMPSNLKYLEIDGELHNDDIATFPGTLLRQKDLLTLKLINFEGLKGLPSGLAELVKDLRELALSNCKSFEKLPSSISNLQSLRVLRLDYCKILKELPINFGKLSSLVELDLSNCQNLTQLPEDFGLLKSLQVLSFKNCKSLEGFNEGFEKLSSLRILNLSFCKRLQNLPPHLGNLTSLDQLDLAYCSTLNSIPESVEDLKLLPSMDISWCSSLKELPDKFCNLLITSLKLNGCGRLQKLPDQFGKLQVLKVLKLKSCARLQKLPESFSQLKDLVHLDLSMCSRLEELCEDVHGLSSLRTLCLDGCNNLKKLPTGFNSLSSLENLDLSNCKSLGGEWMDTVVRQNSLSMVYIRESAQLVKRWGELKGDHRWAFKVDIGQDLPQEEKEYEWKNLSPTFEGLLTNRRGEPFHLSACPDTSTILLVLFDGHSKFNQDFPWPLIEETIADIQINFEIVYIGKHFSKLPKNVAEKIMGRALDDGNARLLFENLFFTLKRTGINLWRQKGNKFFAMSTKIVKPVEYGDKYISGWELLSNSQMEEFVLGKCGRCLSLKKVAAETQASNKHLLRELFVNEEQESCLLRNSHKVGVEELEGKTILLEIRLANDRHDQIRLQSLTKMYITEKENEEAGLRFEIISIPISQVCTKFEHFSGDVPWLVVQNPCTIGRAVKYFLIKQCQWEEGVSERSESWYPSRVLKIEPNGKIATYKPVLSMLERWGAEAYPFTDEKIDELRNKEWNEGKSMSTLEFLFNPLKRELDEVKKLMHQGKKMCLLCDGRDTDTKRVGTKTSVSSIERAFKDGMDNMHVIYVPLYVERKMLAVTDSIYMSYFPFEEPKMPEEKENLGLEPSVYLSQWAAMRFWARVNDLRKEIKEMDENDKHWDGMKALLESLNFGCLSKTVMYEDGNMVTMKEK